MYHVATVDEASTTTHTNPIHASGTDYPYQLNSADDIFDGSEYLPSSLIHVIYALQSAVIRVTRCFVLSKELGVGVGSQTPLGFLMLSVLVCELVENVAGFLLPR